MKHINQKSIIVSIITLLTLLLVCNCSNKNTIKNKTNNKMHESHQPYNGIKKEDFDSNTLYTKGKHCPHKFKDSCSCNSEYKIPYSQSKEAQNSSYCPCSDLNPECLLLKQSHFKIPDEIKSKCHNDEDNDEDKELRQLTDGEKKEMLLRYAMLKSRKLDRYPWFD